MVFFISDLHFYHFNIIKSCSRPFRDEIEMNEKLIENFNSTVSENDEVYILGDLAYRYPDIQSVNSCIARLSGIKHLVVGNHDIELLKDPLFDRSPFRWIKNYYEFPLTAKKKIVLFHYPIFTGATTTCTDMSTIRRWRPCRQVLSTYRWKISITVLYLWTRFWKKSENKRTKAG